MKLATVALLPVLATALAACGSTTTSERTDASAAPAQIVAGPTALKAATPKEAAALRKANAAIQKAEANAKSRSQGATATQPARGATTASAALRQSTGFGVGSGGIFAIAPSVNAGAPFVVALVSLDGKAHTVKLGTPTSRTVNVPAQRTATIKFPAIAAGKYSLELDGKRVAATLSVVQPRR
jgi:hypothetical protein